MSKLFQVGIYNYEGRFLVWYEYATRKAAEAKIAEIRLSQEGGRQDDLKIQEMGEEQFNKKTK